MGFSRQNPWRLHDKTDVYYSKANRGGSPALAVSIGAISDDAIS